MRIARAESAQYHTAAVGVKISIGISEVQQLRTTANVKTAVAVLQTRRHQQAISENCGFIRVAIAVRVFQNDDFIIRHLARLELRVDSAASDPKPSSWIESHLDRFYDAVSFGRKQPGFETIAQLES